MMTRKQFRSIASILNNYYRNLEKTADFMKFRVLVNDFIQYLRLENKMFDTEKFVAAVYKEKNSETYEERKISEGKLESSIRNSR